MEHPLGRDALHIKVTAVVAVVLLLGIGVWQVMALVRDGASGNAVVAEGTSGNGAQNVGVATDTESGASSTDPISAVSANAVGELVGAYAGLQESGTYSTSTADNVANSIGMGLSAPVTYPSLTLTDIPTSPDTSYQAMLTYRAALQTAMKPLLQNTQPEYTLFGMYLETQDQTYLDQLTAYANTYEEVASSTAQIVVPADAAQVQLGLVNSMSEFATVLQAMVAHANDPIASSVLLENYNEAESDLLNAFQTLVTYEQSKTQ